MNNFEKLGEFKDFKNKMLYTFCFYKITITDIQIYLSNILEKIGSIKDTFKRKLANDRVFGMKSYFDTQDSNNIVNGVFLVDDKNKPIGFYLDKNHIQILTEFKIPFAQYFCDNTFNIEYVKKLVSSNDLVNVISIDGSTGKIIQIDSVKNKHHDSSSNIDNLITSNKIELIFGTPNSIASLLKKYPDIQYFSGKLSNDQIWEQIIKNANIKTQTKFNTDVLLQISNIDKCDLFVFGRKNVRDEILSYSIKKLYVCTDIYNKYKMNISPEYFNFEINIVDKITSGDYGDILFKNFEGVVAIKYF